LCRWLLLSLDRLQTPDLVMTQELIANMLGVRREGVTEAAANLQRAGLIQYRRGHITVLDRGEKIAEGGPDDIRANPRVVEAYLGKAQEAPA